MRVPRVPEQRSCRRASPPCPQAGGSGSGSARAAPGGASCTDDAAAAAAASCRAQCAGSAAPAAAPRRRPAAVSATSSVPLPPKHRPQSDARTQRINSRSGGLLQMHITRRGRRRRPRDHRRGSLSSCVLIERIAFPARLTAPPILECLPRTPENRTSPPRWPRPPRRPGRGPANKSRVLLTTRRPRASSFCVFCGVSTKRSGRARRVQLLQDLRGLAGHAAAS